jgi:hypothetical protein
MISGESQSSLCSALSSPVFQIAGCRGIIPLLGEFEGATPPQGFEAFTPLRGHIKERRRLFPHLTLLERRPPQGCGGERGAKPPARRGRAKTGARHLPDLLAVFTPSLRGASVGSVGWVKRSATHRWASKSLPVVGYLSITFFCHFQETRLPSVSFAQAPAFPSPAKRGRGKQALVRRKTLFPRNDGEM